MRSRATSADITMARSCPPPRPGAVEERIARFLLLAASPPLGRRAPALPSPRLGPPSAFATAPRSGVGRIEGDLFRPQASRGLVVFLPPWVPQGGSWLYRHGRVETVVDHGYAALVADLPGFPRGRRGPGFFDREVCALLEDARALAGGRPLHLWGISSGGYWAHLALGASARVEGAVFEDVAVHLLSWAHREAPQWRFFYGVFERFLTRAWPFLDLRGHAPCLGVGRALWISGGRDRGVLTEETERLAQLAGGESLIVSEAGHLGSRRLAPEAVTARSLATFAAAEEARGRASVEDGARPARRTPLGRSGLR